MSAGGPRLLAARVLGAGVWTRQGIWEETAPQKADPFSLQAVYPQRSGEDPGGQRQIRRQDLQKLGAI